jgi:hypothetical protein
MEGPIMSWTLLWNNVMRLILPVGGDDDDDDNDDATL